MRRICLVVLSMAVTLSVAGRGHAQEPLIDDVVEQMTVTAFDWPLHFYILGLLGEPVGPIGWVGPGETVGGSQNPDPWNLDLKIVTVLDRYEALADVTEDGDAIWGHEYHVKAVLNVSNLPPETEDLRLALRYTKGPGRGWGVPIEATTSPGGVVRWEVKPDEAPWSRLERKLSSSDINSTNKKKMMQFTPEVTVTIGGTQHTIVGGGWSRMAYSSEPYWHLEKNHSAHQAQISPLSVKSACGSGPHTFNITEGSTYKKVLKIEQGFSLGFTTDLISANYSQTLASQREDTQTAQLSVSLSIGRCEIGAFYDYKSETMDKLSVWGLDPDSMKMAEKEIVNISTVSDWYAMAKAVCHPAPNCSGPSVKILCDQLEYSPWDPRTEGWWSLPVDPLRAAAEQGRCL